MVFVYMVNAGGFFFPLTKIISIYIIFLFIVVVKILKAQNQSTNIHCHKKDMFSWVLEGIIKHDIASGAQSFQSQWVYLPETT